MSIKQQLILPTIKLVKDLIGDQLSQSPSQTGTTPSVIQSRSVTPKPSYPYVSLGYQSSRKVGSAERDQYLDDNLDEVTETDRIIKVVVRVHASEGEDSMGIAENFAQQLTTTKGKRLLHKYYTNASLLKVSNVSFYPALMITEYEEESRISLEFWTRSIIVDETVDVIEDVIVTGELYEDYGQDYPPLNINVKAP